MRMYWGKSTSEFRVVSYPQTASMPPRQILEATEGLHKPPCFQVVEVLKPRVYAREFDVGHPAFLSRNCLVLRTCQGKYHQDLNDLSCLKKRLSRIPLRG